MMQPKNRSVVQVKSVHQKTECNGFLVGKVIGGDDLEYLDPFLMFDHIGPVTYGPGEAIGAPDHPHRGMLIVNYLLQGSIRHADTLGNAGELHPGSVQLLACARGLVHFEMPSDELAAAGGAMEGFQLWVNVPRQDKLAAPAYQEVKPADLPLVRSEDSGAVVRVLSGEALGVEGGLDTTRSLLLLDVTLEVRAAVTLPVPADFDCLLAYAWRGRPTFHGATEAHTAAGPEAVVFDAVGSHIALSNAGNDRCRLLIVGARRLKEPLVRFGPFAMGSQEEIDEATADYQDGRMGHLDGAELRLAANEAALKRLASRRQGDVYDGSEH